MVVVVVMVVMVAVVAVVTPFSSASTSSSVVAPLGAPRARLGLSAAKARAARTYIELRVQASPIRLFNLGTGWKGLTFGRAVLLRG